MPGNDVLFVASNSLKWQFSTPPPRLLRAGMLPGDELSFHEMRTAADTKL